MGNRGYVLDGYDGKTRRLEGSQGGLAARAGALNVNLDTLHAVLHGFFRGVLGGQLGREGGALPGTLEALHAGTGPGNDVARGIGHRNNGIVEGGLNMDHPTGYILSDLFFLSCACLRHDA